MSERHGERPFTPADEPAPTLTSKARSDEWEYDRRQTGGDGTPVGPRRGGQPAPTLTAAGLATGCDVIRFRNGAQANAAEREADEPAPTILFGHDAARVEWTRPAPTIVTTRRSDKGLIVGRQLPEGEGRNVGGHGWGEKGNPSERPATTVAGDPRIPPPGHHGHSEQGGPDAIRVSIAEASVLQGFAPDHPWQGSRTKQFEQIGNAVPPPLARVVLEALTKGESR